MMKRFSKAAQGVTLLEIMLVLAVAATIIVMSVRYYQSATSSSQANTVLQQIQAITAAADNLAQSSGSYSTVVTSAALLSILPASALTTPWGATMGITVNSASDYTVTLGTTPTAVCPLLIARLTSNNHYTVPAGCASYTYKANP